jgi:hypothetical protein
MPPTRSAPHISTWGAVAICAFWPMITPQNLDEFPKLMEFVFPSVM